MLKINKSLYFLILYFFFSTLNANVDINKIWLWEDTENNQFEIENLVSDYTDLGISVGGVIIDSPWQTYYNSLKPDENRYPDLLALVKKFKKERIGTFLWITPYINYKEGFSSLDVRTQELVEHYSFNNSKKYPWWKGSGALLDFSKQDTEHMYFNRLSREILDSISGFKVDMVAQPSKNGLDHDLWLLASRLWYNKALSFVEKNNKKMLARGWGHQGGFHSLPGNNLINWGGDYDGSSEGFDKQMRDLCISVTTNYKNPMIEIGGFHGKHSSYKELYDYISVSNGFPFASIGGRNWKQYKDFILQNSDLRGILQKRDIMIDFFNNDGFKLKCELGSNTFESENYYIVTSKFNKISDQKLFNISSNKFELATTLGVFIKPNANIILQYEKDDSNVCFSILNLDKNEQYSDGCLRSVEIYNDVLHVESCSKCIDKFEIGIDKDIKKIIVNNRNVNFTRDNNLYTVDLTN